MKTLGNRFLSLGLISTLLIASLGCTWGVDEALSDIDLALQTSQVVCSALGVVAPADSAACQTVAAVGIAGITVVQTTYNDYKASGAATDLAKLQAALAAVKTNLPQALAAAHIVNPALVAVVTSWVGFITSTVNEIVSLLPQLQMGAARIAPSHAQAVSVAAAFPTPEVLQARWQAEVCLGNVACGKLVKVHHIHAKWMHRASLGIVK